MKFDSFDSLLSAVPEPERIDDNTVPSSTRIFGCKPLDSHFGLMPSSRIIGIAGMPGSFKSRISLSTAMACAMKGLKVLFVDTSNTVSHQLLRQSHQLCLQSSPHDIDGSLKNLDLNRCFDIFSLMDVLCIASAKNYDMIIVDGMSSIFTQIGTVVRQVSWTNIESYVADLALLLRKLSSMGATVLFTVLPRELSRQSFDQILSDIVDISIVVSVGGSNSTTIRSGRCSYSLENTIIDYYCCFFMLSEVVHKPPYYADFPSVCEFESDELFNVY